jgi:O-antigen/teichoic acid export membrane protein
MAEENSKAIPTIDHKPHAAFFRQSGWLMMATIIAGTMAYGVHFLAKKIPESEYSIFGTMLMVTACIPTLPLQMVFAQQTAGALATNRGRQLAGMIRLGWLWTLILWAAAALVVLFFQNQIAERWQLNGLEVLWVTLAVVLMNLWMPLFSGVLQGRQDFFWLGWGTIVGGFGRVAVAAAIVLAFRGGATGMIFGAFVGLGAWAGIAIWRTRDLWRVKPEPFDGRGLFKQVAPLMLGFGACQFLFTTDTMYAKAFFSGEETAPYGAAGTLSRALLWLVLPLAAVMFPKIVHSTAKSEKSNLLGLVLLGTAVLVDLGVLSLWILGPLVVRIVYPPEYVSQTLAILPWYAGAMVPLALANVLVNDLLGRGKFQIVPFLVLLAIFYGLALTQHHDSFIAVLKMLGAFNLVLFAICAWFVWGRKTAVQK